MPIKSTLHRQIVSTSQCRDTDPTSHKFWISPSTESPYEIDLTEFFIGGRWKERGTHRAWTGDFGGRPKFGQELASYLRERRPIRVSAVSIRVAFRGFYRFLQEVDPARTVESSVDVTDAHGDQFLAWASKRWPKTYSHTFSKVKSTITALRGLLGARELFWPARPPDYVTTHADIDEVGIRRLFDAFRAEGQLIKQMFAEGEILANQGCDPRGERRVPGSARWNQRANHAWLVWQLTKDSIPDRSEFLSERARGLHKPNSAKEKHSGPAYLAPLMTDRERHGISCKLRWFHPSYGDTAIFLWLFLIQTGWNLSTALAIDIGTDADWFEPHPQKKNLVVLHSFKHRADRHQFAISSTQHEWRPYQIIRFLIERTAPLRRTLKRRALQCREEFQNRPRMELEAEISRLESAVKSPWLFHFVHEVGSADCFRSSDSSHLNDALRAVVARYGLAEAHPSLAAYTTSDMRDAWIGHAYSQSGHDVLIARLAAQHSDFRALRHYVNRHRYRAHSEVQIRKVHAAAFSEIQEKRPLDPARLRILVERGFITKEQDKRLTDHRQRTRLGMGCLDPLHPPSSVAPGHPAGKLCRIQRCLGCEHGVVFQDSLESLGRAYAELIAIKKQIPYKAWVGSSFESEEKALSETFADFNPDQVSMVVNKWIESFRTGEAVVHDIYPSY